MRLFGFVYRLIARSDGLICIRAYLLELCGVTEINDAWLGFAGFVARIVDDILTSARVIFLCFVGYANQAKDNLILQHINNDTRPYIRHFCKYYLFIHNLLLFRRIITQ